ncbi:MAG TPA: hypothetical protein VNO55_03400 [Polyangia bacterium]|nr:hypothetical protein [Polyangia bacterium]
MHPTTVATLRLSDPSAYGLFVQLNRARFPNGKDVGELLYQSTLYDLSDGKTVWRSLVDVGDLAWWVDNPRVVFCRKMLARAKDDEVLR